MACSLSPSQSEDDSHFTAQPGPVTLKIKPVPSRGTVLFMAQSSIKDEAQNDVPFTLLSNNQKLKFTAAKNHTYTLFLPFVFLPSTSVAFLQEDCPNSSLNEPLLNINFSITLVIDC